MDLMIRADDIEMVISFLVVQHHLALNAFLCCFLGDGDDVISLQVGISQVLSLLQVQEHSVTTEHHHWRFRRDAPTRLVQIPPAIYITPLTIGKSLPSDGEQVIRSEWQ